METKFFHFHIFACIPLSFLLIYQCCEKIALILYVKEVLRWLSVIFAARAYISVIMSAILIEEAMQSGTPMFRV